MELYLYYWNNKNYIFAFFVNKFGDIVKYFSGDNDESTDIIFDWIKGEYIENVYQQDINEETGVSYWNKLNDSTKNAILEHCENNII